MQKFEYKVVPAPKKPGKIRGVKGTDNKFAAQLAQLMNEFGAEGWEYQRTDTLPCEERKGLTGRVTTFQNMLVFRRALPDAVAVLPIEEVVTEQATPLADPAPAPVQDAMPVQDTVAAPQPPQEEKAPVFTFRAAAAASLSPVTAPSETMDPAPATPKIMATKDAPEGNAPEIRFRPSSDQIAAQ
jgi:hypothetical protein